MNPENPFASVRKLVLSVLLPSLYFLPLAHAYFSDKNYGFGNPNVGRAGLGIALAGIVFWSATLLNMGKAMRVLPGNDRLVTHGVYRYVRHPMYIAITLAILGFMLASGSMAGMIYLAAVIVPLNIVRARLEDAALERQFGETYKTHRERTWF
jgi:protein-S-isoprenylcysteine O-methyltransferase Ste14